MAGKPLWRRAYDAVERPVGSRLETAVQTEQFADLAGLVLRLQAGVNRQLERTTRHALHRVNLPAASDVARLRDQVVELSRTVSALELSLREAGGGGDRGTDSRSRRPGGQGAPRRRPQPAPGTQRGQVRDGDRQAAGGADT